MLVEPSYQNVYSCAYGPVSRRPYIWKILVNGQARRAVLYFLLVLVVVKFARPTNRTLYVFDEDGRISEAISAIERESKQEHNMINSESFVTY